MVPLTLLHHSCFRICLTNNQPHFIICDEHICSPFDLNYNHQSQLQVLIAINIIRCPHLRFLQTHIDWTP